jgi:hypothetical protein
VAGEGRVALSPIDLYFTTSALRAEYPERVFPLPPQIYWIFATNPPGTTVAYGGGNYVVSADRTMSPVAAAAKSGVWT